MLTKILKWMLLSETEQMHVEQKVYVQNELIQFVPQKPESYLSANLLFRP